MKYIAIVIALAIGWAESANAALVTFDFTSVANATVEGGPLRSLNIPIGQAFSGSFTWDTAAPPTFNPVFPQAIYLGAFKSITLGSLVVDVSGWRGNDVVVSADGTPGAGLLLSAGDSNPYAITLFLTLKNPAQAQSTALPLVLPPLSDFRPTSLILEDPSGVAFDPLTSLTSPSSVPEPSAIALFGTMLLGFGWLVNILPQRLVGSGRAA